MINVKTTFPSWSALNMHGISTLIDTKHIQKAVYCFSVISKPQRKVLLSVAEPFQALNVILCQINLLKSCVCTCRWTTNLAATSTVTEQPVRVSVFLKALWAYLRVGTEYCQPGVMALHGGRGVVLLWRWPGGDCKDQRCRCVGWSGMHTAAVWIPVLMKLIWISQSLHVSAGGVT